MTTIARPGPLGGPTAPGGTPSEPSVARRSYSRMVDALSAIRTRRASPLSLEGIFLTVGTLCLPVGIVTILLGWYGSAHTGHPYEQTDYLISGGLLGLGLIVVGAVLCHSYWMARQIQASESSSRQVLEALERLEARGAGVATGAVPAPAAGSAPGVTPSAGAATPVVYVVTEHGSMRHRPECPAAAGQSVRVVSGPEAGHYRPCAICLAGSPTA